MRRLRPVPSPLVSDLLPSLRTFHCFACGVDHPKGLGLRFREAGPDRVASTFTIGSDHVGIGTVIHGGIIATILDEAMAWCLYRHRYRPHVTATMEIRFRGVGPAGAPLEAVAAITEDRGRRLTVRAEITGADGVVAEATGLYVPAPAAVLDALPAEQRTELEALFADFRRRDGAG